MPHAVGKAVDQDALRPTSLELFDLGHKLLPDLHEHGWWLNSALPVGLIVLCALRKDRKALARNILSTLVPLVLARMVTSLLTIPPPTKKNHTCKSEHPTLIHFLEGHCFDHSFSGHTAMVAVISLVALGPGSPAGWVMVAAQMLILLLTRGHYTIDVVVSAAAAYMFHAMNLRLHV